MYLLIRFFAGGPYRFLIIPFAGLAIIGTGTVRAALHGRVYGTPEIVFLALALLLHLAVLGAYVRLLVRGEARKLWADVLDFLDQAGRERQ
jgi:hypothetical protein